MTPHFDEPRGTRWLVYVVGGAVFVGILYFCLRRFCDASYGLATGVSIPIGLIGFWIFAKVMEDIDTPPGFWDDGGA